MMEFKMNIYMIVWIIFLIIYILFIIYLFLLKNKIEKFEFNIINDFKNKNNLIPAMFEITKNYISKHDKVFEEIIKILKKDFLENNYDNFKLIEKTNNFKLIHNELNFIFRICNTNQRLIKNEKFLYTRDLIINKSLEIWNKIEKYKQIIKIFNKLIFIKNITTIWILVPIEKKDQI